ncbi:MAG TPA: efflux RND transporter periplasmic adaptor subunit, partial [Humisphaera sp.]
MLVIAVAAAGCDRQPNAGSGGPGPGGAAGADQAPVVTAVHPVVRRVAAWDEYPGRIEASETVEVRARVSGYIAETPMVEGKLVEAGERLFLIDARPYQAELDRANAEVARTQSAERYASSELKRVTELQPTGAATGRELFTAQQNAEQATAAVAAAKATAETARLNVEWCTVTAPIKGRVGRRLVTKGNLIGGGGGAAATSGGAGANASAAGGGGGGTLLTTITAIDPVYCYIDVDERTVRRYQEMVRAGVRASAREGSMEAFLSVGSENAFTHKGRIDFVDNRIDPGTGTISARGVFENRGPDGQPGDLLPGYYARLRVPGRPEHDATLVPEVAIGSTLAQQHVLVAGPDGLVGLKPITPGEVQGGLREVDGVGPGDVVIVNGLAA